MNKKTRALTEEQYRKIITTINEGFVTAAGERVKPNSRIATALTLEANLGLRISDILHLTINQIVKDGDRYRLDLVEQKTGKKREFTVPTEIYIYIQNYALENNINPRARLFQITERTVQRHLKMVCDYLEYEYISTHSFRKFFAINSKGGINMGKYFAAKALNLSNSIKYDSGISIDEVIIVPDFKTFVSGMVNYLDVNTLDIQEKKMEIEIEHMDGAGIFIPGTFPCSCQIRGGWLKGAVFPFDFHKFIEKYRDKVSAANMIDAWGNPVTVEEFLNAKMILTDSQLKMRKYYDSMQEYRKCFKKAKLSITVNNCAHQAKSEVKVAYQPFQTIPRDNLTDETIKKLADKTVRYIEDAKKNPKAALQLMGIEIDSEDMEDKMKDVEMNVLHAAILKYPQLLNDIHVQKIMKSVLLSERRKAQGCKLVLDGFWSYICPDLYAFCQWLFLGQDVPEGLVPNGYIYNHYYNDKEIEETCCLRYPHLSDCEHGIRKVLQSKECEEWFNGTDTIVSSHDLISEVLQADWDGDHICLVHDKAFMDVLERDKYPLFYDMTKAESAQITNNAVMNCLISSFQNENIGFVSNAITKIFNSEGDPDTKLVRVLCAYNNFVIDYFKTQKSMDLQQYTFIYEEYKDSDKHKCPHFFMYAKDKKQKQCEKSNLNGNADRISKYISDKTSNGIAKVNYSSKDAFNPEMLKNSDIKVDRTSEKYSQLRRLLLDLKREHSAWYKKVKDDLNAKESEKQLFNIYCGAKVKEIFPDRKEAANYLVDIEYHTEENQEEKKDILWNCYGDILYDNLCKNVDSDITPKVKRNVYQKSVDREKEILESRDRIKKEQEEIVKVLITKTVYDDLMGIKVRKGCEKDRYILYILYVLIRRFQAKYGEEKEYIRIYKGLRQKSKITAATIDNWIDSKCTQKGLDRLEKNKYIRREHMQNYDKVYLRELPETDVSDIVFDAESNNPLLDLWEYNGERKVAKCEICNKKFVVVGNTKTCSDKCSKVLVKRNKNKTS